MYLQKLWALRFLSLIILLVLKEFDWEAAVREIDVACQATNAENPPSTSTFNCSFDCNSEIDPNPVQELRRKGKFDANFTSVSSTRQSTLDSFVGFSSNYSKKSEGKAESSNGLGGNTSNGDSIGDHNVAQCDDTEMLNGLIKIDAEAAKTWIYPGYFLP